MSAAMHPVPERWKAVIVIFDIRALWRSPSLAEDALFLYPYGNIGIKGLMRSWLWCDVNITGGFEVEMGFHEEELIWLFKSTEIFL